MSTYQVRLQQFEGPLDLLLFFIRRDELDIYDIPIARIADEYLSTIRLLEEIDLDGVGDFLYMAALLINIKTRMLLPHPEIDDDGEPIDPRQELVERLLEYVRFKEAAEHLEERQQVRLEQAIRGTYSAPDMEADASGDTLVEATVFDLIGALRRVLSEPRDEPQHTVAGETWSVEEQREYLLETLADGTRRSFVDLMGGRAKPFVIATFLAVLEMARLGEVSLFVETGAEDFYLESLEQETKT